MGFSEEDAETGILPYKIYRSCSLLRDLYGMRRAEQDWREGTWK